MKQIGQNQQSFVLNSLLQKCRVDGRQLLQKRDIQLYYGTNPGEIEIQWGQTILMTKIQAQIVEPNSIRPNEGIVLYQVDLSIMNNEQEQLKKVNYRDYQNEIQKLLERVVNGSKVLDPESLVIVSGKQVWKLIVETVLVNNDGNLIDATYLSVIVALLHFKKPQIGYQGENIFIYKQSEKPLQHLAIHHIPILFTFGFFEKNKVIAQDLTKQEESVAEGRVTIGINIYKDICVIHKPGGAPVKIDNINKLIMVCNTKVAEMTQFIRNSNKNFANLSIFKLMSNKELYQFDAQPYQNEDEMEQE